MCVVYCRGPFLVPLMFIMYAENTELFASSKSQSDLMMKLKIELSRVTEWLKLNNLTLNIKKKKYVIFGSRIQLQAPINYKLEVNVQELERIPYMEYLVFFRPSIKLRRTYKFCIL